MRSEQHHRGILHSAFGHLRQYGSEELGGCRGEPLSPVVGGGLGDAVEEDPVDAQAAHGAGYELGEGMVEQSAQGGFHAGRVELRTQFGTHEEAEREGVPGKACEQAQQGGGFGEALSGEGVEGELPGAAEQVAGFGAGFGAPVQKVDGVEAGTAVESVSVVGEIPRVEHLLGEESAA